MGELRQALNAAIREHARQRVLARLSEAERTTQESAAAAVRAGRALSAQQVRTLLAHAQAIEAEVEAFRAQLARTAGRTS